MQFPSYLFSIHCFAHLTSLALNPLAPPPFFDILCEHGVIVYSQKAVFLQLELPIYMEINDKFIILVFFKIEECKSAVVLELMLLLENLLVIHIHVFMLHIKKEFHTSCLLGGCAFNLLLILQSGNDFDWIHMILLLSYHKIKKTLYVGPSACIHFSLQWFAQSI